MDPQIDWWFSWLGVLIIAMNPIKPEVIHEIHTAVSVSEEFFLSMAALHTWPCPKETRCVSLR